MNDALAIHSQSFPERFFLLLSDALGSASWSLREAPSYKSQPPSTGGWRLDDPEVGGPQMLVCIWGAIAEEKERREKAQCGEQQICSFQVANRALLRTVPYSEVPFLFSGRHGCPFFPEGGRWQINLVMALLAQEVG